MDGITCNKEGVVSASSISVDIIPAHPCSAVQSGPSAVVNSGQGLHRMARRRFQQGHFKLVTKADGSKHWILRYWQDIPDGDGGFKRARRKVNLGSKAELPTKALAKQAGSRYLDAENHIIQAVRENKKLDENG